MNDVNTSPINVKFAMPTAKSRLRSEAWLFLAVAAVVFVTRIPFLDYGYGSDSDGWLVALAAKEIATSGHYVASRLPGYPVQELTYALIYNAGPLAFNTVTAILSALGVSFFVLLVKAMGGKGYILAGLALAFTPVVYINSANAMDYVWELAFMLGSLYFVLGGRPLIAGALMGLAIGSRISSGAMLVPLSLMLYQPGAGRDNLKRFAQLWLGALLVGGVAFLPVILSYGSDFLTIYPFRTSFAGVMGQATVGVWGEIGTAAIVAALAWTLWRRRSTRGEPSIPPVSRLMIAAWLLAIGIYALAYFRFPYEAGYLTPAVPFAMLLLGRFLARKLFHLVCIALLVSPFIFNLSLPLIVNDVMFSSLRARFQVLDERAAVDFVYGPLIYDHLRRVYDLELVDRILTFGEGVTEETVVVTGNWYPKIVVPLGSEAQPMVRYFHLLDEAEAYAYVQRGVTIYLMPGLERSAAGPYGSSMLDALDRAAAP